MCGGHQCCSGWAVAPGTNRCIKRKSNTPFHDLPWTDHVLYANMGDPLTPSWFALYAQTGAVQADMVCVLSVWLLLNLFRLQIQKTSRSLWMITVEIHTGADKAAKREENSLGKMFTERERTWDQKDTYVFAPGSSYLCFVLSLSRGTLARECTSFGRLSQYKTRRQECSLIKFIFKSIKWGVPIKKWFILFASPKKKKDTW